MTDNISPGRSQGDVRLEKREPGKAGYADQPDRKQAWSGDAVLRLSRMPKGNVPWTTATIDRHRDPSFSIRRREARDYLPRRGEAFSAWGACVADLSAVIIAHQRRRPRVRVSGNMVTATFDRIEEWPCAGRRLSFLRGVIGGGFGARR